MAQGKKSFIAYSDWKDIFDELPNEDAGALIKHIFAYVNDENPVSDSILIKAVFANIKSTLKRDLDKWESQLQQRKDAGKRSAELRALKKTNETPTLVETRRRNPTDSVNVNDTVNVNDILEREKIFKKEIFEFKYPEQTLNAFFDYWSEPNKSKTKMRFEREKTWDLSRRLKRWNSNSFGKKEITENLNDEMEGSW